MQQGTCPTCRLHVLLPEEFPGHPSRHLPKIWSKEVTMQKKFSYHIPKFSFAFCYELIVWVLWRSVFFSIVQKKLADIIKAAAKEYRTNLQDLELNWKGLNFRSYIIFVLILVSISFWRKQYCEHKSWDVFSCLFSYSPYPLLQICCILISWN